MIQKECFELVKKINFGELKNKSVLITGASGLIGVYLVSCLKEIKNEYNISINVWIKNDIEKEFKDIFDGCNIIKGDITDINSFTNLPKYDVIIHAAGYGQPGKFMENKIKTITLNTMSTIKLLEKVNEGGKFLFVSTSELYNGLESEMIEENEIGTTTTEHPRACYIESKRCGETICFSYLNQNIDIKIIRLSLAYGPGTKINDHRVLNSLIQKGLMGDKIELMDGGDAVRTYCYITNVIEMFWNILLFGKKTLYNVGGESKITILELAKLIGTNLNKEVIIPKTKKELLGNPKVVNISIKSYTNEFNRPIFVSLDEGIKRTIEWQKKIYEKSYI